MKKTILFSFLILGIYSAFSQSIILKEDKIITKNETLTGWLFNVCDDLDYAKDDIKDFLKEKYDFKAKKDSLDFWNILKRNKPRGETATPINPNIFECRTFR